MAPLHPPSSRLLAFALAALTATATAAGCGSSSHGSRGTGRSDFLAFSHCMRSHGVPDFPDPSPGGGIQLQDGSGMNPLSPAFRSAQAQCRRLLPGGGPPRTAGAQTRTQLLEVARCMRAHGITDFPDPTLTPPSGPPAGGGVALGRGGVFLIVPASDNPSSPGFKTAANACHFG